MSDDPQLRLTRRQFTAFGATAWLTPSLADAAAPTDPDRYRPQVHFAPPTGFMNDPNGLVFHEGEYHLFYQYDPFEPKAGHVHWGHAVSPDLLHWRDLPIVLADTPAGMPFSGSAVVDHDNRSGLFAAGRGGIVAIYTRASATKQAQAIAWSTDNGRTFHDFPGNPVLDVGSTSFRDPKVFWHAPTGSWIMVVARSREHRVIFYRSGDLTRWTEVGAFGHAGLLGTDYECPGLVELPVEGGGSRWVLFVSINPGAPLGGSCVQYFVGDFDGRRFTAEDAAARLADFGQDFYALQTFANVAGPPVAIAWMSNWLYTNDVPFSRSRGAMTLPRRLSLRRRADDWRLVQRPVSLDPIAGPTLLSGARPEATGHLASARLPGGVALEIAMTIAARPGAELVVRLSNATGEQLRVGFATGNYPGFYIDRSRCAGFGNAWFAGTMVWAAPPDTLATDLRLVIDRDSIELFGLAGEASGTALHYFTTPPDRLDIVATGPVALPALEARLLRPTVA